MTIRRAYLYPEVQYFMPQTCYFATGYAEIHVVKDSKF